MTPSLKSLALATTALALAQGVGAAAPADCTVKARSDKVVLMHCKANLEDKALAEAAKAVCEPGKACNVWIWDDLAKMPTAAPKTDAELPKSATGAAVAIWVNDSANLMTLKKVR
jgi:hypothetical protein